MLLLLHCCNCVLQEEARAAAAEAARRKQEEARAAAAEAQKRRQEEARAAAEAQKRKQVRQRCSACVRAIKNVELVFTAYL
jgi:colicin import membrane protein